MKDLKRNMKEQKMNKIEKPIRVKVSAEVQKQAKAYYKNKTVKKLKTIIKKPKRNAKVVEIPKKKTKAEKLKDLRKWLHDHSFILRNLRNCCHELKMEKVMIMNFTRAIYHVKDCPTDIIILRIVC